MKVEADSGHFEVDAVALDAFKMVFYYTMINFHMTRHGLDSGAVFQLCHKKGHESLSP